MSRGLAAGVPAAPRARGAGPARPPAADRRPTAASAAETDWRQISVLYGELLKYDPSPVTVANRAVAVAMAEGPAAGLTILDVVLGHPQLARWPRLHVARADLLARMGRDDEAARAYRIALELEPPAAERRYIQRRLARTSPA